MDYSLPELIKFFEIHAAEFEKKLSQNDDGSPCATQNSNIFVLPRALLQIVTELQQLKDQYESDKPKISTDLSK